MKNIRSKAIFVVLLWTATLSADTQPAEISEEKTVEFNEGVDKAMEGESCLPGDNVEKGGKSLSDELGKIKEKKIKGIEDPKKRIIKQVFENYETKLKTDPENVKLLSSLGHAYYAEGNFKKAEELFSRAYALDPNDIDNQLYLGLTYFNLHQIDKSISLLEAAFKEAPENSQVLAALGRIEQLHFNLATAEKFYLKSLQYNPNDLAALSYLGSLRLKQKRYSDALFIFEKVQKLHPNDKWVGTDILRAKLGSDIQALEQMERTGDLEQAVQGYQTLLAGNRTFLDLYLALGNIYVEMKKYREAINLYNIALNLQLSKQPLLNAWGSALLAENNLYKAKEKFELVLKSDPTNAEAYAGLGKVALREGDKNTAKKMFLNSLTYDPYNLTTLNVVSKMMVAEKKYCLAIKIFRRILKIQPNSEWVKTAIQEAEHGPILDEIELSEKQNDYQKAEELYEKLIYLSPGNVDYYVKFGRFYYNHQSYQKAIDVYKKGLSIDFSSVPILTGMGYALLKLKHFNKSEEAFRHVLQLNPLDAEALAGMGAIAEHYDDFTEAENFYLKALTSDPDNVTAQLFLGNLKLKEYQFKEALRIFERLRFKYPQLQGIDREIQNAKDGPLLKQIQESEKANDLQKTIRLYFELISGSPKIADYYSRLGRLYMKNQQLQNAENIYRQGLKIIPDSEDLKTALGFAYLAQNNIDESRQIFESVLKVNLKNSEALVGLGRIFEIKGDTKNAIKFYTKALRYDPNNITALSYLGNIYFKNEQYVEAEKLYRKLELLLPGQSWVRLILENIRYAPILKQISILEDVAFLPEKQKQQQLEEAEKLLRELVNDAPLNPDYYLRLGLLLVEMKRYTEAIGIYKEGLFIDPEAAQLKIAMGYSYLYLKDLEMAKPIFEKVLSKDPENPDALAGIGEVAALSDNTLFAEAQFRKALEIDPNNINALSFLSALEVKNNRYDRAEKLYKKILQINPKALWAEKAIEEVRRAPILQQIHTLEENQEYQKAAKIYLLLLEEGAKDSEYYLGLGNLYVKMKDYDQAIATYLKGLNQHPDSESLKTALGFAYLEENNLNQSLLIFESILTENPRNSEALGGLGRTFEKNGDLQKAGKYYREALKNDPNNITALIYLGDIYFKDEQYVEAEKLYRHLERLLPNQSWVHLTLENIQNAPILKQISLLEDVSSLPEKKKMQQLELAESLLRGLVKKAPLNPDYYLRLGLLLTEMKRYEEAIKVYEEGLSIDPEAIQLKTAMGFAYLHLDDLDMAKPLFEEILVKEPENPDAFAGIGEVAALKNDTKTAEIQFRKALQIDPENITALSFMAALELKNRHYGSAEKLYQKILEVNPKAKWAERAIEEVRRAPILQQIHDLEEKQEFGKAIQLYLMLLDREKKNPEYYLGLGNLYVKMKNYHQAVSIFREGLEVQSDLFDVSESLQTGMAYALLKLNQYTKSEAIFRHVLDLNPSNAEALAGMGALAEHYDNYSEAEDFYLKAIKADPDNITALLFLGNLKLEQSQFKEALRIFERLRYKYPQLAGIESEIQKTKDGPILKQIQESEKANDVKTTINLYRELIAQSSNADYYDRFGRFYMKIKQPQNAENIYVEGLKFNPGSEPLKIALGYSYLAENKLTQSLKLFESLLEENPQNSEAAAGLGRTYEIKDNKEKAKKFYVKALEIDPNNITALTYLGNLYFQDGQYAEAEKIYQQLDRLLTNQSWVHLILDNIRYAPLLKKISLLEDVSSLPEKEKWERLEEAEKLLRGLVNKAPRNPDYYLRLGNLLAEMKRYHEAIEVYKQGLHIDPKSMDLKIFMGFSYLHLKDLDTAKLLFEEVLAKEPENPDAIAAIGQVAALKNETKNAEIQFWKALDIDPYNITALSFLGDLEMKNEQYTSAENVFRKILKINPKAEWAERAILEAQRAPVLKQIHDLENNKEYEKAAKLYLMLLDKEGQDPDYYLGLGNLYVKMKEYDKAIRTFRQGLKINPGLESLKTALGYTYLTENKIYQSLQIFQSILKQNPRNSEAVTGLGRTFEVQGDQEKAKKLYAKALKIDPNNISALIYLGNLYFKDEQYAEAEPVYQQLEYLLPNQVWIHRTLDEIRYAPVLKKISLLEDVSSLPAKEKLQQQEQAENLLRGLIKKAPDNPNFYWRLGLLLAEMKRYSEAIEVYKEGLLVDPKAIQLEISMGYADLYLKDTQRAKSLFEEVLTKEPENPDAIAGMGQVAALRNEIKLAETEFEKALEIDPNNINALSFMGAMELKNRQYKSAKKIYKKILQINPKAKWAEKGLIDVQRAPFLQQIHNLEENGEYEKAVKIYQTLMKEGAKDPEDYLGLGNLYVKMKDYDQAMLTFHQGLEMHPESVELSESLQIGIANTFLKLNQYTQGEAIFKSIIELNPSNAEALAGLGAIAEHYDNFAEAEKFYLKAIKADPDNITAPLLLGNLKLKKSQFKEAQRIFERLRFMHPQLIGIDREIENAKAAPILKQIQESEKQNDAKKTEHLYLELVSVSPKNSDYYSGFGRFYLKNKQPEKAEEIYLQGLKNSPDSELLKTDLGYAYLAENKLTQSLRLFQSLLKENEKNSDALAGLARAFELKGDQEKARILYTRALKLDPNNITALTYLGNLYFKDEQYAKAEKLYQQLERVLPNQAWVTLSLENIRYAPLLKKISLLEDVSSLPEKEKVQQQEEAEKLLRELVKKAPDNPDYYLRLGMLLGERKRFDEAIEVYRQGLHIDPKAIQLEVAIGYSYLYLEDHDMAKTTFEKVLAKEPENPDAIAGIGQLAELKKETKFAETQFRRALDIDPHNINALSFLAALKMKNQQYEAAKKIFEQILQINPKAKWAEKAIEEAQKAPVLQQIRDLEENENYQLAAKIYSSLLSEGTNDVEYYLGLGNLYVKMKDYAKAITIFSQGLEKNPESTKLMAAIGISYIFKKDLANAKMWLEKAKELEPDNAEALAGLGRIEFINGHDLKAENIYEKILINNPENAAVLSFYGELLMKEKRYEEALALYNRLSIIDPHSTWVRKARQSAIDGPLLDSAQILAQLDDLKSSKKKYLSLIEQSAGNPDYYLYLGDIYVALDDIDEALVAYQLGLQIDPNSPSLWRATAIAYMNLDKLNESACIFNRLIAENPDDADSWAGLGRIKALRGFYGESLGYYSTAQALAPENQTALTYMAQGEYEQEHYFSAAYYYEKLHRLQPLKQWILDNWTAAYRKTRPHLNLLGKYYEEDQWDKTTEKWSASYIVYGAGARLTCPLSNYFRLGGYVADEVYKLNDKENEQTLYSINVSRAFFEGRWTLNPCYYADVLVGLSCFSRQSKSVYKPQSGVALEPNILLTWHRPKTQATYGLASDTNLVARDFVDNESTMVTRYFLFGNWEREIFQKMNVGLQGGYYYLNGFHRNYFQRAMAWTSWNPKVLKDWVTLRYFFQYQNFDKVIPDYYTYAPQLVNHLQIEINKYWDEKASINLGYGHGWQSTRTRFQQIIVLQPPIPGPMFWDRRDYNICFLRASYEQCPLKAAIEGSFYRDSTKYTIWFVNLNVGWQF